MNRSTQEQGSEANKPAAADATPAENEEKLKHAPHGDEAPALPLDDVEAVALEHETRAQGEIQAGSSGKMKTAASVSSRPAEPTDKQADHTDDDESVTDAPLAEQAPAGADDVSVHVPEGRVATSVTSKQNGYGSDVVVHHDRGSVISEQYRAIRLQMLSRNRNKQTQTHVITSSAPQEGKTVTTINLGIAFSELSEARTLLLECDLRRPTFAKQLNRDLSPGIVQLLRGGVDSLDDVIHHTVYDNLDFIPAGDRATNSTELLSSPRMAEVIEKLKERYDHIIIDTPPVISVTDACILGTMSDEVLMIVRLNKTPVDLVDRAKRLLRASHCDIAGVILTHQHFHVPNYLYQYV